MFPMPPPPELVLLWCVAGAAALFAVLPPLLHLAGLCRYRGEMDDNPAAVDPEGDDPFHAGMCAQLASLGFQPLGTHRDLAWFFASHWFWSCRLNVFGSRQHGCFACVYRLLEGEPVRVAFATCFTDGALVWTGNHMQSLQITSDDHVRWGVQTSDLTLLLREHGQMVERFAETGSTPDVHGSLPVFTASMERHVPRSLRRARNVAQLMLGEALFWIAGPPLLVMYAVGSAWLLPVAVVASVVVRHVVHRVLRGRMADERRHQVAREGIVRYRAGTQAGDSRREQDVRTSEEVMERQPPGALRRG